MRDAQSLLEQLLSFGGDRLTVELVQQQLGIASDDRTLDLLDALSRRDAAEAIRMVDQTSSAGFNPPNSWRVPSNFLRDIMMVAVKCSWSLCWPPALARSRDSRRSASRWPLETLLAALQILAEARGRLRGSPHGRTLVEIAILRVALLDNLASWARSSHAWPPWRSGAPPVADRRKKKASGSRTGRQRAKAARARRIPRFEAREPESVEPESYQSVWKRPVMGSRTIASEIGWAGPRTLPNPELSSKLIHLRPSRACPSLVCWSSSPLRDTLGSSMSANGPDFRLKIEAQLRSWLGRSVAIRFLQTVPSFQSRPRALQRHPGAMAPGQDGIDNDPLIKLMVELGSKLGRFGSRSRMIFSSRSLNHSVRSPFTLSELCLLKPEESTMFNNLGNLADLMRNAGKIRENVEKATEALGKLEVEGHVRGWRGLGQGQWQDGTPLDPDRPKLLTDGDAELLGRPGRRLR